MRFFIKLFSPGNVVLKLTHYYFRTIDLSVCFPIITALLARRNPFALIDALGGERFKIEMTNLVDAPPDTSRTNTTKKSRFPKKAILTTVAVIASVWLLSCAALYDIMLQSPETFARFMSKIPGPVAFLVLPFETLWTHARAGHLEIGDAAPDFSLMKLDKSASVQLSNLMAQGRPVVLIFGSYT
jgi:hypothetical protein